MLSCEYCEIFKSTRFEQHLRTADSELGSRFENHTDSIILLKYQSLANQYFKHNLRSMPSLNFTPVLFLNLGFLVHHQRLLYKEQTFVVLGLFVIITIIFKTK